MLSDNSNRITWQLSKFKTYLHEYGVRRGHGFKHVSAHVLHTYLHTIICIRLLCIYTIDEAKVLLVTWEMGSSGHDMREVVVDASDGRIMPQHCLNCLLYKPSLSRKIREWKSNFEKPIGLLN